MTVTTPPSARQSDAAASAPFDAVAEFTRGNGLSSHVETSKRLISETFNLAAPVEITDVDDPDGPDRWIEVSARVRGEIADVREAHRRYTRAWLAAVPADKVRLVRLAIQIVESIQTMKGDDFLTLAEQLVERRSPCECRAAVGRAYYGVLNAVADLMRSKDLIGPQRR